VLRSRNSAILNPIVNKQQVKVGDVPRRKILLLIRDSVQKRQTTMDRNQKTVFLTLLGTVVLLVAASFAYFISKREGVVHCPDGSSHGRMNADQFETRYTGYSAKLQAKLSEKNDFAAEFGTQKLQEMSEALQLARLHLQALVAGYDVCAVDEKEFNNARNRYQQMEDIAHEVNDLSSHAPLTIAEETRVKQLIEEYIRLSHSSSVQPQP